MKTHNIEPAGALPSYDKKDLVVFHPEDEPREIVCRVVGHQCIKDELLYQLEDPLTGDAYLASFRTIQPHISMDPFDDHDCDPAGYSFEDEYASLSCAGGF